MSAYDWDTHELHGGQQRFHTGTAIEEPSRSEGKGGKRSRQTYSKYQTAVLETVFRTSKYIVRSKRQQMSAELNLTERQIKIWFQNRRMKEKKCHRDVPRGIVDHGVPVTTTAVTTGYGDGYAVDTEGGGYLAAVPPTNNNLQDDAFTVDYHGPAVAAAVSCKRQDDDGSCYAAGYGCGGGGYDLLTPEPTDPYGVKQQWPAPVTAVDFHQDLYGDHDLGQFQRLPMTHHHHRPMNSQVHDYFGAPQLQAAHGY